MPTKKERILLSFFIQFAHMGSLREKTWSEKIALALFQEVSGVGQCLVVCHAGIRMLRVRSPQMQLLHPCVFITHWLSIFLRTKAQTMATSLIGNLSESGTKTAFNNSRNMTTDNNGNNKAGGRLLSAWSYLLAASPAFQGEVLFQPDQELIA